MDIPTSAAIIVGLQTLGKPTADVLTNIIGRLLGPAADAGGETIRDWVFQRRERATAVVVGAAEMLAAADLKAQGVPGRILLPIIQNSSLEDDDELRNKWTALLANAASPGPENLILPAYAEILRQLIPTQAKILDYMHKNQYEIGDRVGADDLIEPGEERWNYVERSDLMNRFALNQKDYTLLASDLLRLQLIDVRRLSFEELGKPTDALYGTIRQTALGLGLLRACDSPPPRQPTDS